MISEAIEGLGKKFYISAEVEWIRLHLVTLVQLLLLLLFTFVTHYAFYTKEQAQDVLKLVDKLEQDDDVQEILNFVLP